MVQLGFDVCLQKICALSLGKEVKFFVVIFELTYDKFDWEDCLQQRLERNFFGFFKD